jgi:hypothetical protein
MLGLNGTVRSNIIHNRCTIFMACHCRLQRQQAAQLYNAAQMQYYQQYSAAAAAAAANNANRGAGNPPVGVNPFASYTAPVQWNYGAYGSLPSAPVAPAAPAAASAEATGTPVVL